MSKYINMLKFNLELSRQAFTQMIPIPNDKFHQLVKDVCVGVTIDECYGQIEDWVNDMSHAI